MEERTANWLSATAAIGVLLLSLGFAALIFASAKTTVRGAERVVPGKVGRLKLEKRSGDVRFRVMIDASGTIEVRAWEGTRPLRSSALELIGVVLEQRRQGCQGTCLLAETSALQGTPIRLTVRAAFARRAPVAETFRVPAVLPKRRVTAGRYDAPNAGIVSERGV